MTEMSEIIDIADGNPGALEVMARLMNNYRVHIPSLLVLLKENHIKGTDIWTIYKLCKRNLESFLSYPFETYKSTVTQ